MPIVQVAPLVKNPSALSAMKLILIASVAVGVSASILAWRERPKPGSIPLVFLLSGQCWWSAAILFRLNATSIGDKIFWLNLSWIGTIVIPVAWLFFCLEYTGYDRYVQPRYIALVSLLPVATAVISVTNEYHHLLYVDVTTIVRDQRLILTRTPGPWYWVIAGYTYLLGILGAIPLLQFITSNVDVYRGQSLALLFGLLIPWTVNILYLLGFLPTAEIDPTPAAFTVSGVAYLGAITQFQLFGTNPAPIRQARFTVFEQMQDGAVVVDRRNHIVEMNRQAEEILEANSSEILGSRIEDFIPQIERTSEDQTQSSQTIYRDSDNNTYDIAVTQLTNSRGRQTGRIITLHDIGEYVRQQQRLEVLNRVFRHNIRTNTQVIVGKTEYLADHNSREEAEKVKQNAWEIEEISEKIRTVLNIFEQSREQTRLVSLNALLQDCSSAVQEQYPETTIQTDLATEQVYVSNILEDVLVNLIENAAEHNTNSEPKIWIESQANNEHGKVIVADNGPGIDDQELSLLEEGGESPLKHGTGFGLAIIIWGTEIVGGETSFEENEPTGTVATIQVPIHYENDQTQDKFSPLESR